MDLHPMRDVWSCVAVANGVHSVMASGIIKMLRLCVVNWDLQQLVKSLFVSYLHVLVYSSCNDICSMPYGQI